MPTKTTSGNGWIGQPTGTSTSGWRPGGGAGSSWATAIDGTTSARSTDHRQSTANRLITVASVGRGGAGWQAPGDTGAVGYNPYRRFRARPARLRPGAVCLLVAVALVVWAIAG